MFRAIVAASMFSMVIVASPASARILTFDFEGMALQKAMKPANTALEREQKAAAIRYVTELMRDAEQSMRSDGEADQLQDNTLARQSAR